MGELVLEPPKPLPLAPCSPARVPRAGCGGKPRRATEGTLRTCLDLYPLFKKKKRKN